MAAKNHIAPTPIVQSGIYQIRCLINGKIYVGSTANFKKRWNRHRRCLIRQLHHSCHLQRAWNIHGPDAFVFEILEIVEDVSALLKTEQDWLDRIQPWRASIGYNIAKLAEGSGTSPSAEARAMLSALYKGKKRDPEVCARISAGRKGVPVRPETREKLRAANLGKTHDPEARAKLSEIAKERRAAQKRAGIDSPTFASFDSHNGG